MYNSYNKSQKAYSPSCACLLVEIKPCCSVMHWKYSYAMLIPVTWTVKATQKLKKNILSRFSINICISGQFWAKIILYLLVIICVFFSLTSLLPRRFDLCSPPAENLCHLWRSHLSPQCTSVGKIIMLQMKLPSLCRLMFNALPPPLSLSEPSGEGQWIYAHPLFTRFMFI